MIREKIQRNHKVEACEIIFVYWMKNEHHMRIRSNENMCYRSSDNVKRTVRPK
ncbi:hypothetical protein PPNK14_32200 [Pectobacterium parmentieri]|nr:hypothetical protein PB20LOC_02983 [Pectobacterium parmentieri]